MRSSCDASPTNRRIRSSELRACRSEARRSANASSIRPSITLKECDSEPTSVRGSLSGTRCVRSPPAIASAVRSTSTSGRSDRCTTR